MLECLKEEYDVTLFTFSNPDLKSLNETYGTRLSDCDVQLKIPRFIRWIPSDLLNGYSSFTLRQHLLIRYFKSVRKDYDLAISAFNEMDMGSPGIQYIHFPMFARGHEFARKIVGYPDSTIRAIYRSLCRIGSNFSEEGMRQNYTIANSNWTAAIVKQLYDIDSMVVYPPVVREFPNIPWEERESGFVLIGRIVPEKRIEKAIRILREVRSHGHDIHLHIIGGVGLPRYKNDLQQLCEGLPWVFWENRLTRAELNQLVPRHKYGLHVRENEQFGIGIAEMVTAGCIPFVPSEGGQVEIVGENKWMAFQDEDDAAKKITMVLSNKGLQSDLRHLLIGRANLFSTDRFNAEIRGIVENFLRFKDESATEESSDIRLRL
jgi:glycosyltransferase involved in cell wall biosynthesis